MRADVHARVHQRSRLPHLDGLLLWEKHAWKYVDGNRGFMGNELYTGDRGNWKFFGKREISRGVKESEFQNGGILFFFFFWNNEWKKRREIERLEIMGEFRRIFLVAFDFFSFLFFSSSLRSVEYGCWIVGKSLIFYILMNEHFQQGGSTSTHNMT